MRRHAVWLGLVAWASGGLFFAGCGGNSSAGDTASNSTDGGPADVSHGGDSGGGGNGQDGSILFDGSSRDGSDCVPGQACGDGGVCTGAGVCCPAEHACGSECCSTGQICSFGKCVTPGNVCEDKSDCPDDQFCDLSLGENGEQDGGVGDAGGVDATSDAGGGHGGGQCSGGVVVPKGRCIPRPPRCEDQPGGKPGETCIERCEVHPKTIDFTPEVKYTWGGQTTSPYSSDVMMTPIVVQLDDDDCDGKVTERDIPEIVFSTFSGGRYYRAGTLHVLSIVGGKLKEKWTLPGVVHASTGLAAADLDGDGVAEIVACRPPKHPGGNSCCDENAQNTGVVAFKVTNKGLKTLWTQDDTSKVHCGYEKPAIADPKHDGHPTVLVGLALLDGRTGKIIRNLDPSVGYGARISSFADVDGDGVLDVVDGMRAYRVDGTELWNLSKGADARKKGFHAIGDFDRDGTPEVVFVTPSDHKVYVVHYDAASKQVKLVRSGVDINNGKSTASFCHANHEYGGGPPTVADFNGDGYPDVGIAGAVGYVVLDGKKLMDSSIPNDKTVMWFRETQDCSSAVTGSAVFDFNGDGKAEVIYGDEIHLWMYDGQTGKQLIPETCNTSGTLYEYPVVADVDNDGHADIVLASNAYSSLVCRGTKQSGIRILGSKNGFWVRTRRIWNQHTYHVGNIEERGTLPAGGEKPNWTTPGLNNFRQNKQPGSEFAAPDLVVTLQAKCAGPYGLIAQVRNIGESPVPAGIVVGFYRDAPDTINGTKLGEAKTAYPLSPLQSTQVVLLLDNPAADITNGSAKLYAVVDDVSASVRKARHWQECRTDNNASPPASGACEIPK